MTPLFLLLGNCSGIGLLAYSLELLFVAQPDLALDPNAGLETAIKGGLIGIVALMLILLFSYLTWREVQAGRQNKAFLDSLDVNSKAVAELRDVFTQIISETQKGYEHRNERLADALEKVASAAVGQQVLCAEAHEIFRGMKPRIESVRHSKLGG